jgi:hypothetical protein
MPEEIALIQPAPVVREADGWWHHPNLPVFEEGQAEESRAWVKAQGLAIVTAEMEYEVDTDNDPYFEQGEGSCAHWEPSKPEGDGWFVLAISDTDSGPACWWARRKPLTQPLTELRNQAVEEWLEDVVVDQGQEAAEKCKEILLKCGYCTKVTP